MLNREAASPATLPLRDDCLAKPTAYDVAVVAAVMLFPDDESLRRSSMTAITIDLALQSDAYPQPRTAAERREHMEVVRGVPRIDDYGKEILIALRHGIISGAILRHVLGMAALAPDDATMAPVISRIAQRHVSERISEKTINNRIWPKYRCVAAYWAAYLEFVERREAREIPCRPHELGLFLGTAEDFRAKAEKTRMKRRRETLLDPGKTVAIPTSLTLPKIDITFELRA